MMILAALVLALLACLAPMLLASRATGSLVGRVKGANGETVLGAVVTAGRGTERYSSRARTTGSYYIGNLPPGAYDLHVTARGYSGVRHSNIEVIEGQEIHVDVMLTEARSERSTDAPITEARDWRDDD